MSDRPQSDSAFSRKIHALSELRERLDQRRGGERVVLCHGVFDLLHVGHLRHLRSARRQGDILVVTVTADTHITKGPDRPVFTSMVRTEMLASLELVDYVAIVDDPTALPAIEAIRPDVYVKGSEYKNAASDITGMITAEQSAVEANGGRVVFSYNETYSSSNLLNRFFGGVDADARSFLQRDTIKDAEGVLEGLFERISGMRIAVVGEAIIDHYVYVDTLGKAAKENIIATLRRDEEVFAGGAVAIARHLSSFCDNVDLIAMVGVQDRTGDTAQALIAKVLPASVQTCFVERKDGPTVRKTRFVEPTYVRKLFEVYDMNDRPLGPETKAELHDQIRDRCGAADLIMVCDFGHGLIDEETVELLESMPEFLAATCQSNAGNLGYNRATKYRKANLICIDALEARLATARKHLPLTDLVSELHETRPEWANVIVTDGSRGCVASNGSGSEPVQIPAFSQKVVDTIGAGDVFFAVASSLICAGASCELAGFMGNIAGAIKIGIVGHRRPVEKLQIKRYLETLFS